MIRTLVPLVAGAMLVSACAGPIETRIETHLSAALPAQKSYSFAAAPGEKDAMLAEAEQLVAAALDRRGFSRAEQATMLVDIALSDRPAEIAITAGDGRSTVAAAKERKPLQSCADREHRISVVLFALPDGRKLYTGNAAEYHCSGTMAQSLPFLVDGALSGMNGSVSGSSQQSVRERTGVE